MVLEVDGPVFRVFLGESLLQRSAGYKQNFEPVGLFSMQGPHSSVVERNFSTGFNSPRRRGDDGPV